MPETVPTARELNEGFSEASATAQPRQIPESVRK